MSNLPAAPPTPLACPDCETEFYPTSNNPHSITSCPRCGRSSVVRLFQEAQPLRFEDLDHPTQTAEERAAARHDAVRLSQQRFMVLAALIMLGAVGIAGWVLLRKKKRQGVAQQVVAAGDAAPAFEVAKNYMLTAKDRFPADYVRDAERVKPLWEWYYQQPEALTNRWVPQGFLNPRLYTIDEKQAMALTLVGKEQRLDVLLEGGSAGWKLDWEALSGVHGGRWQVFLKQERAIGPEGDYRVHVELMPSALIMPSFRTTFPESQMPDSKILKIFAADRDRNFAVCIVTADSMVAEKFVLITESTQPTRMVLKLKMLDAAAYPPRVATLGVLRKGWEQLDPPSSNNTL